MTNLAQSLARRIPLAAAILFACASFACEEQTTEEYFDEQQRAYCKASIECGNFRGTQSECIAYYKNGRQVVADVGETCAMNLASYRDCWADVKNDSCSASLDECSSEWSAWIACVD
jgi:hypothetical protein